MAVLNGAGWMNSPDPESADLIVVNSCGFIDSAKQESIDSVLEYRAAFPDSRILLAGCLAQRYSEELSATLVEADAFFGNADLSRISDAADAALLRTHGVLLPAIDPTGKLDFSLSSADRPLLSLPGSAYVKITEGCDNCCSYCAIPLIRGGLRSRSIQSIFNECEGLIARGIRELCLIGQDLGSFGKDGAGGLYPQGACLLPDLLAALSKLKGEFWIRMLYIHPDNFPLPVLELCRKDPRILPYFDIPFQHASAPILKAMNRRGSPQEYLDLIQGIRSMLPDATLRSTFLVGFPGETEADFQAILDFLEKAQLDWAGVFTYSREEGTPAYSMKGRVPKKVAQERKRLIEEAQTPITEQRMDRFRGKLLDILVEERVENEDGLYLGRVFCQAPEVDGATVINADVPLVCGTFVRGRIFARAGFDLDAAYSDDR